MNSKTILMLVGPEYEDLEVWYPKLRLEAAGWRVPVAGLGEPIYRGKHGYPCPVDGNVKDYRAADLAGIFVPGGWAPDKIRRDETVLSLLRDVHKAGGLIATICHGPWVLVSAGIVKGRRLTSTVGIRDDVVNAGQSGRTRPSWRMETSSAPAYQKTSPSSGRPWSTGFRRGPDCFPTP